MSAPAPRDEPGIRTTRLMGRAARASKRTHDWAAGTRVEAHDGRSSASSLRPDPSVLRIESQLPPSTRSTGYEARGRCPPSCTVETKPMPCTRTSLAHLIGSECVAQRQRAESGPAPAPLLQLSEMGPRGERGDEDVMVAVMTPPGWGRGPSGVLMEGRAGCTRYGV